MPGAGPGGPGVIKFWGPPSFGPPRPYLHGKMGTPVPSSRYNTGVGTNGAPVLEHHLEFAQLIIFTTNDHAQLYKYH